MSNGKTVDGYGWCHIVGGRMGLGSSDGRTEDGDGEGNDHGLIEEIFQHLPRRSLENNKNFGHIFALPCRNSNRPSYK